MGATLCGMTAGDALRRELEAGSSVLGLAKRLAGSDSDSDPEVKRWRYVVMRAARGGEPAAANVDQIARTLGVEAEPRRRVRPEEVAADRYARILENQKEALLMQEEMRDELREIRRALESPARAARTAPRPSPD